ncbi:MAG: hypothetical protein ACREBU_00840 [Nitrososphaera sp.]
MNIIEELGKLAQINIESSNELDKLLERIEICKDIIKYTKDSIVEKLESLGVSSIDTMTTVDTKRYRITMTNRPRAYLVKGEEHNAVKWLNGHGVFAAKLSVVLDVDNLEDLQLRKDEITKLVGPLLEENVHHKIDMHWKTLQSAVYATIVDNQDLPPEEFIKVIPDSQVKVISLS